MNVFFLDWELWQKLTFVLACCIVIVFATGLFRLSHENRLMRRLHELDEEKRMRTSEIRHCGISAWGPNEIPFGVRAIQRGVQVEGIWISRSDTPDISQVASSTTLVADRTELGKIKSRWADASSVEVRRSRGASCGSNLDQTVVADILHETTQTTLVASVDENLSPRKGSHKTRKLSKTPPCDNAQVETYIPTGLHQLNPAVDGTDEGVGNAAYPSPNHNADTGDCLAEIPSRIPVPHRHGGGPMLYNRVGRRACRNTRQVNRNFVVVPTARQSGSIQPSAQRAASRSNIDDVDSRIERPGRGPSKLRKKPLSPI